MYSSSKFVFLFCKVMGVAPVELQNNQYRLSLVNFCANLAFLTCLVFVGFHALISDYKSTFRGKSVRMKSRTAVVVTFLELLLNVTVFSSGIIGAAFSYKKISRIENMVKEVDARLSVKCSSRNFTLVLGYILLHHLLLIYVDIRFWFNITPDSWSYAVCYVYLLVEMAIEAQFALVAWNIERRFKKINQLLVANMRKKASIIGAQHFFPPSRTARSLSFETFQKLHWTLCECVKIANNAYGWQLLTSVLCICVHIVVTPYFLLLDLFYPAAYGSADIGFLILQVIWVITHLIHLLLIVMPASAATNQAEEASIIICEYLHRQLSNTDVNKFETFISQLKKCKVTFSACGLFHLQRPVLTSLIGTVVTYLVILIQFQNSDKVYH